MHVRTLSLTESLAEFLSGILVHDKLDDAGKSRLSTGGTESNNS